jgi:hypothetical protein
MEMDDNVALSAMKHLIFALRQNLLACNSKQQDRGRIAAAARTAPVGAQRQRKLSVQLNRIKTTRVDISPVTM